MPITKKDFMEVLERNPSYRRALASVDGDQRARIEKILEAFMGRAVEGMAPVIDKLNDDPELVRQVREHMRRGPGKEEGVVIGEESNVSGSKAD